MNSEAQPACIPTEASFDSGQAEKLTPREVLVEKWRNAPQDISRYRHGTAVDGEGNIYEYSAGVRLWIGDQDEVMDSCQKPWAEETVRKAFEAFEELGDKKDVRVLERGFGLGLIATQVMDYLRDLGGSYTVIELNRKVANYANTTWRQKQTTISRAKATSEIGGIFRGLNVGIEVIEGDAFEETRRLAGEGKKFDIIISDTFPLSEDERSVNDLLDLETLVKCLEPDGVFAFFGYHAGYEGGMNDEQRNLVERNFNGVSRTLVTVNPPLDYRFFQTSNGPLRKLPVIICREPRPQLRAVDTSTQLP
ncbi:MAG: class I SAM-dependent methyltransferase [Candidatus Levybacteria bacterium]|nr:class I SAM-dependent methyltransferase [Candidatus Levybacteria bacterium]